MIARPSTRLVNQQQAAEAHADYWVGFMSSALGHISRCYDRDHAAEIALDTLRAIADSPYPAGEELRDLWHEALEGGML